MAQPTPFNRSENYTEYAAAHPGATFPPASLDAEMDDIELTLDQVCANLALIQRDDGKLANLSVTPDSLSATTKILIGDWNPRGIWATATLYAPKDMVEQSGTAYVCAIAHTSAASFATDTAAGRWINLGTGIPNAGSVVLTPVGGISATNVQAGIAELDAEKAPLASPAFTGNPTAATQAPGNNTTRIATTAFVAAAISPLATKANAALTGTTTMDAATIAGAATVGGNAIVGSTSLAGARTLQITNTDAGAGSSASSVVTTNAGSLSVSLGSTAAGGTASILSSSASDFNVYSTQAANLKLGTFNRPDDIRIDSTGTIYTAGQTAATGYGNRGDLVLPATGAIRAKNTLKAWVNFDGTAAGTITPRDHHNVASVTKHVTGQYTANLTTGIFADAKYSAVGTAGDTTASNVRMFTGPRDAVPTATAYRFRVTDAGPADRDTNYISVQFAGA